MKPRFLFDENVNRAVQRQLQRLDREIEVLGIGDEGAPAAGSADPYILKWIEQNNYIPGDRKPEQPTKAFNGAFFFRSTYSWFILDPS